MCELVVRKPWEVFGITFGKTMNLFETFGWSCNGLGS